MRRKIFDKIKSWKEESAGKTALLIDGARRVGKSYCVEEFAKQEYKSYTVLRNFPLFCPKCQLTHIVDVEKLEIIIKNSEKQTF